MDYSDAVEYSDAIEWLIEHYAEFPNQVPGSAENISRNVSGRMFMNWRWVMTLDMELVFANCIQQGITKQAFESRKAEVVTDGH